MANSNESDKKNVFGELWYRFKKPWCMSFALHFILMIILVGSTGIFLSLYDCVMGESDSPWVIMENIISYSLALVIPSTVLIFQSTNDTKKKVSWIEITVSFFIIIPIILSIISYRFKSYVLPFICLVISWFAWVVANYENDYLNDSSYEEVIKQGANKHGKDWD